MWTRHESLYIYISPTLNALDKIENIACFDLDWTLVKPKSSKFPKNFSDNIIMTNRVKILKDLIKMDFTIVIFTNQKVTSRESLQDKIKRMQDIISKFESNEITVILLMATEEDKYRKPHTGMWLYLNSLLRGIKNGFYCGDAAGRPNDFSDSDLMFAKNIGMAFHLPEDVFK